MSEMTPDDVILLVKHLIEIGAKEIDIVHCCVKHGIMPHQVLLLIEVLILSKEVVRDKKNRLRLAQELSDVPKHIVKIAKECIEEL